MKRVLFQIATPALIVCLMSATALGGGFQLNEHGARALGQGGAWAARAYDLSALYFNPAGLAHQKGIQTYLGTTLIMPKVSYFDTYGNETKLVEQVFPPINLYGSYEVSDGLVAGIGVSNPFGLGTEWPTAWSGRFITQKTDLQSFFISPTVAYKVTDELSIGVGVNLVIGGVTIKQSVGLPFDAPNPQLALDLKANGFGFNVGAQYQVLPELSVGASYRSSVKLDAKGTAKFDPNYALAKLPNGDASAKIELPATGFVGVSYKVMDNLEIEGDYQFVGWSSYKELAIEFVADPTKNKVAPKNYENSFILRLGAEYTMGDMQLRAGYLFDKSPVADHYVDPMLPDANRNGFSLGFGYTMEKQWKVDVAYMYLPFNERTVTGTEVSFDGTYKALANLFGVNIGYSF